VISPEIQAEILSLFYGKGKGVKTISKELGMNRGTVRQITRRRMVLLQPRSSTRKTILEKYKPQIEELLRRDPFISSQTILQRIKESGYLGGYTIVRSWVNQRRELPYRSKEAFLELTFEAGECAQVDWGEFGDLFNDGVKIHCFVMVLCFSRLLYLEFTRSENFHEFIRCHENAFNFFGGVTQECWYDNLASAVTDRMGKLVRFNSRFFAYMGHYGIHPQACNPARGNEKGRVEDGVKYIRSSFFAGREFKDFNDLKKQATFWQNETANKREHRVTRKIPILHFEAGEKKTLIALNPHPYDTEEIFSKIVPPNFHIIYDANKYSVPWTLVGVGVTIRISDLEVKIFYNEKFITKHERFYGKFKTFTKNEHIKGLLERKNNQSRDNWQISAIKSIGPNMSRYLGFIQSGSRSIRKEAAKLLALATVYGESKVDTAASVLLKTGMIGVDNLELLLKTENQENQTAPVPLQFQNQRLNRTVPTTDLRRYDAFYFNNNTNGEKEDGNSKES
jgi:transposase